MSKSVFGGPQRPPEPTNSKTNVYRRSVLGSKTQLVFRAFGTMIELLMIIVRWLASIGLVGRVAARLVHSSISYWAVCVSRRGGNSAVGALPGIGWKKMRLDPVSYVLMLPSPSYARRGSTTCIIPLPFGGA
jgi:hypothetical protein